MTSTFAQDVDWVGLDFNTSLGLKCPSLSYPADAFTHLVLFTLWANIAVLHGRYVNARTKCTDQCSDIRLSFDMKLATQLRTDYDN